MRFSLNWIRDHVEVLETPQALARRLTLAGLPVDQIETRPPLPDTVVVGRVVEAGPHPNADRLSVCKVDVGEKALLDIVCGAPNARAGIHSPVALVGTALPGGMTIKRAKIRGQESRGMLCSAIELGLGEDADGILEIPEAPPGTPYENTLGVPDAVLDIDVPSNRGDALCHLGIAREIAALTGRSFRPPAFDVRESGVPIAEAFGVTVEDPADCPRFTAHLIRNLTVGPSPDWLVHRLESVGQRSINNVVDVTNFVMLETGQPLHSFDLDRLGTGRIHVRRARAGERLTTLDGEDRDLDPEVLLITDGKRPIAAGGVMGGANTEVHDGTRNILLEGACFRPERILRGSRRLRLDTDASLRFRRGVDPVATAAAAKRAAVLIAELGGGELAPGMVEVTAPEALAPRTVTLRPAKVGEVLGDPVAEPDIAERLVSFGFRIAERAAAGWLVEVPSWRRDVEEECDLVEEVARHQGYDTIGVRMYNASGTAAGLQPEEARRDRIHRVLQGFGYHEAITRVLTERTAATRAGLGTEAVEAAVFALLDPPSREEESLRVSLLPSLLKAVGHNLRHGRPEVRFYELGRTFRRAAEEDALPGETDWVGLAAAGGSFPPSRERGVREYGFLDLKGAVEGLLAAFRIDAPKWRPYTGLDLVPEGALEVVAGETGIGFAWEVPAGIRSAWDLNRPVYLAQVRLDALPPESGSPRLYVEPSRYPPVRRDLALVVPQGMTQGELRGWIREQAGPQLERIELFDHYRGRHIPEGHAGLGFSLTFRAADRTLEEKEVDAAVDRVVADLKRRGIIRREG